MQSLNVTDARASLPELLRRVQQGDEITITRHGEPVAVLVRPDILRSRRAHAAFDGAARVHALLETAPADFEPDATLSADRAEELIAAIRRDRDAG